MQLHTETCGKTYCYNKLDLIYASIKSLLCHYHLLEILRGILISQTAEFFQDITSVYPFWDDVVWGFVDKMQTQAFLYNEGQLARSSFIGSTPPPPSPLLLLL